MLSILKVWILLIFSSDVNYAADEYNPCSDIPCHHDDQEVCGVRSPSSREVAYRLFRDKCDLTKFECQEEIKGFKIIDLKYCKGVISLNDHTTEHETCIQCDSNSQSEMICAIRAEGDHFIIREFDDECHMLLYNCEQNLHFSVTDNYICHANNNSYEKAEENAIGSMTSDEIQNTKDTETVTLDSKCIQNDCIRNDKITCAASLQDKRFVVRWFDDVCDVLKYNCEKSGNFFVTDDDLCVEYDNAIKNNTRKDEVRNITDISDSNGNVIEVDNNGDEKELDFIKDTTIESVKSKLPKNVVVLTYDFTENINQTAANFFAASHSMGIGIEKLNEQTRRVIVQNTGPINLYVPRTYIPANYTPMAKVPAAEQKYYKPLLKYCYHRCPEKCPDIYEPVCAANSQDDSYIPYLMYKNHCFMDIAKCKYYWAGYAPEYQIPPNIEAMGFIFCGGSKFMNQMYTFPLMKILQKMGRMKKKGQNLRYVMRNLGQFSFNVKG